MDKRLKDKVIVVTGATKGIGRGIALAAAGEGASVVISGRDDAEGEELVETIREKYNADALYIHCDISVVENCLMLIESSVDRFGRIDGLVNNAGIFPKTTLLVAEEEEFDKVFDVNVKGAFFCTKYALIKMIAQKSGSIVNIGSTHAYGGDDILASYACSKGALHTLSKHVALNYAKYGIRSNWITVGWVLTPGEISGAQSRGISVEELEKNAHAAIPEGRFQTVEDMANGAVFLLTDESNQITGTDLHITGGFNLPL